MSQNKRGLLITFSLSCTLLNANKGVYVSSVGLEMSFWVRQGTMKLFTLQGTR